MLEPLPFGRYKETSDISALGIHGGSDMLEITVCDPFSPAIIWDGTDNALTLRKKAWDEK